MLVLRRDADGLVVPDKLWKKNADVPDGRGIHVLCLAVGDRRVTGHPTPSRSIAAVRLYYSATSCHTDS